MSDTDVQGDLELRQEGLLVPGYIFAFLIPIVGFILGVIVVARGRRPVHGYTIMGIAVVVAIMIAVIVTLSGG
jgi:uncharacterized membrane protein YoaK (UPF0700 family)